MPKFPPFSYLSVQLTFALRCMKALDESTLTRIFSRFFEKQNDNAIDIIKQAKSLKCYTNVTFRVELATRIDRSVSNSIFKKYSNILRIF